MEILVLIVGEGAGCETRLLLPYQVLNRSQGIGQVQFK